MSHFLNILDSQGPLLGFEGFLRRVLPRHVFKSVYLSMCLNKSFAYKVGI